MNLDSGKMNYVHVAKTCLRHIILHPLIVSSELKVHILAIAGTFFRLIQPTGNYGLWRTGRIQEKADSFSL